MNNKDKNSIALYGTFHTFKIQHKVHTSRSMKYGKSMALKKKWQIEKYECSELSL